MTEQLHWFIAGRVAWCNMTLVNWVSAQHGFLTEVLLFFSLLVVSDSFETP